MCICAVLVCFGMFWCVLCSFGVFWCAVRGLVCFALYGEHDHAVGLGVVDPYGWRKFRSCTRAQTRATSVIARWQRLQAPVCRSALSGTFWPPSTHPHHGVSWIARVPRTLTPPRPLYQAGTTSRVACVCPARTLAAMATVSVGWALGPMAVVTTRPLPRYTNLRLCMLPRNPTTLMLLCSHKTRLLHPQATHTRRPYVSLPYARKLPCWQVVYSTCKHTHYIADLRTFPTNTQLPCTLLDCRRLSMEASVLLGGPGWEAQGQCGLPM